MANSFIHFGTWRGEDDNTLTDLELTNLTSTQKQGIAYGEVAYSNILNGLLRQITLTNKAFADLVALKSNQNINSSITDAQYLDRIELAIENIAKEVSPTLITPTFVGTKSGITVNSQGLVSNIINLAYTDLPSVSQFNFLGRTLTGSGEVSAITRDNVIGISGNGFVRRTGENAYESVNETYVLASQAAFKDSRVSGDVVIWRGTEAEYDALVIPSGDTTLYFII